MRRVTLPAVAVLAVTVVTAAPASSQAADGPLVPVANAALDWAPITPPGFDEGMEIAGVYGDPAAAGKAYTLRLRLPDGYRFPPHFHPKAENVTVLDGTFLLAMGEEVDDDRLQAYAPGDYLFIEPEHPHFGGARGETTIQLHGVGPFEIIVVGSPEDTRGK
ncbi:MAG: cupin domain-containing protein [Gemmatimonadetes bacterium]|nr:cupin domain-containing protein [Gemmatimonadota bacterium]NIQ53289.1 cupin domain-containing protein [Gemmatimonadota bacterium]NIU73427.1 cupin domain-containing protein [Gammaproteobacteria bacterium]NIX43662.1 cupin domain-containing protein [Gemmatimonadota bacterium]NIY07853.1 cupin domain-containing protein [Gemmatimonadota bacterium]